MNGSNQHTPFEYETDVWSLFFHVPCKSLVLSLEYQQIQPGETQLADRTQPLSFEQFSPGNRPGTAWLPTKKQEIHCP